MRAFQRERRDIAQHVCSELSFIDYAQTAKCITARVREMEARDREIALRLFAFWPLLTCCCCC